MLIIARQQRVLDLLRQHRTVELEQLARELDVSVSTIRRDLEALERQGVAERTHGGAVYLGEAAEAGAADGIPSGSTLAERMAEQVAAKRQIGAIAAGLVQPQMTVILDGGSTVIYAARQITARPIQVVTNSLPIANLFSDDEQVELILIGGSLYPRIGITIGAMATGCLADLHADLLLFSLAGLFGDAAFNVNMAMAEVEQTMMRQAARSVLLMDAGKFGRKSLARVCGVDEVDHIISDAAVPSAWQQQLGDRLTLAAAPQASA